MNGTGNLCCASMPTIWNFVFVVRLTLSPLYIHQSIKLKNNFEVLNFECTCFGKSIFEIFRQLTRYFTFGRVWPCFHSRSHFIKEGLIKCFQKNNAKKWRKGNWYFCVEFSLRDSEYIKIFHVTSVRALQVRDCRMCQRCIGRKPVAFVQFIVRRREKYAKTP